jgi:tetratricopeptide (TPR) repeat protein
MKARVFWLAVLIGLALFLGCTSHAQEANSAAAAIKKGDALREKGNLDAAISAYTEAIRRDAKSVMAHLGRGIAYSRKADAAMPDSAASRSSPNEKAALGKYEEEAKKAYADYAEAIRINKKEVEEYVARRVAANKRLRTMGPHNELMMLQIALQMAHVSEIEANLQKSELYEPVAETLILYCQSDPKFFPRELGPVWFPEALGKQGGFWAMVTPESAHIEFGGGFYHFGYSLQRGESTPEKNVWRLFLQTDRSGETPLCTKSVPSTNRLSAEELLARVLPAYDKLLAQHPLSEEAYQEKISFLLRLNRAAEARATCKAMREKLPENWWANIVCALAIAAEKSDDEAERFLSAWAKKKPTFSRYLDLAYYFQLRGQPKRAAAAMMKATQYVADRDEGHLYNLRFRGYSAALYAFRTGEYQAATRICNKLLETDAYKQYATQALRDLRAAAETRAKGEQVDFTPAKELGEDDSIRPDFVSKLLQGTKGHVQPRG